MSAISANKAELLAIANAVASEKMIDKSIVIEAMEEAIQKSARNRYGAENDIRAKLDPQTGAVKGQHPWRSWKNGEQGEPDTLAIWPQWEQTNVFATPYYVAYANKPEGDPSALRAGIWTLDLEKDTVHFKEFENAGVVLFSSVVNPVRRDETYTVYTQLTKVNTKTGKMDRVDLDHTYYNVNVSSDGKELYIGGTQGDIAVYDSATLKRIGNIRTPGGGDQVLTSLRIFQR